MNKRIISILLKYGLGLLLLAYLTWRNRSALIVAWSRPLQVTPLLLSALIYAIGALLTFYRWYILVRAQDLPFTRTNAFRLGLLGFAASPILPGSIGGDLAKSVFLAREQSRRTIAVATVLLDRAMGLWGIFWMVALIGGIYWIMEDPIIVNSSYLRGLVLISIIVIGVTLTIWLIMGGLPAWRAERFAGRLGRIPKVGHMAAEFWRAVWMYRLKRNSIAVALLMSLVSQVCFVLAFFCAAQVLQDPDEPAAIPSLMAQFLIVPIGVAIMALFPAPGGVGGAEAGFSWLFTLVGGSEDSGFITSVAQRIIILGLALLSYIVFLQIGPAKDVARVEQETAV